MFPTPVEEVDGLWVKRDDRNAEVCGGNKVRALEFLLGGVTPGDVVVTLGARGSTHVLATAVHAARLGATTVAYTWPQEMNPTAHLVAGRIDACCARVVRTPHALAALARYALRRQTASLARLGTAPAPIDGRASAASGPRMHFVPVGGTSPLGMRGHVAAGIELAAQIEHGLLPCPATVVVPLGSGGTAAGIAMGLGVAGVRTTVTAVRVVPWLAAPPWRIPRLIRAMRLPAVPVHVDHTAYGGAYGRPLPAGRAATQATGLPLDDTYGAKACAVALAARKGPVLLWVTFNARALLSDLPTCDRPAP